VANQFAIFDPIQYANLALIQLHKALGMAQRVHRGYDKNAQQKGSTISIPIPSTFTAQDAPGKEVKFGLTDKELNYTQQQIIDTHIVPAAYALADQIDQDLCGLTRIIPWYNSGVAGTTPSTVGDITGARKVLFNNKVPLVPGMVHLMIDGNAEEKFLQLAAFTQNQGSGQDGINAQMTGSLGTRYGLEIFSNQNVITNTPGALTATGLVVNGAVAMLGQVVNLSGTSVTGTLKTGDILQFAGDPQKYAVVPTSTNHGDVTYTASGNAVNGVSIFPHLKQALANGTSVTVTQTAGTRNCAFHRNAFVLAMAPLTDLPSQLGAKVATVSDPVTGLAIRSRVWYEGNASKIHVGLDVLYGFRVLDSNLASIMMG
jgi:hypothetical protein